MSHLFLLAGFMYLLFNIINYIFINNCAGGEIHRISFRPEGVTFGIVTQIFSEYVVIISLLIILFIYLRHSTHWTIFSAIGCSIFITKWYEIIYLIKDKEHYIFFAITILFVAIIIIFSVSALSAFLIQRGTKR